MHVAWLVEGVSQRFGTAGAADCLGGGFMGWAFCVWFGMWVLAALDGSVGPCVFDGRVGRYEFGMGLDSFSVWADVA